MSVKWPQRGMTCRQPARIWEDAFPTGNGVIGAMVYGHIRNELILFNHDDLWLRRAPADVPDISEHLPELRQMILDGRYQQATDFLDAKMREHGYPCRRVDPYHPAFDLRIEQETVGAFRHYRRALNFITGEAIVAWQDDQGALERRTFCSRANDMSATVLRGDGDGAISATLALIPHNLQARRSMGAWQDVEPDEVGIQFETSAEIDESGQGWLTIVGTYQAPYLPGQFGGVARIAPVGGQLAMEGDAVRLSGADRALVLVALFANEPSAEALPRLRQDLAALPASYDALLARHAVQHKEAFMRLSLDLNVPERTTSNEDLLLDAFEGQVSRELIERMADYGRYLLICSSAPGGMPANLQGLWNGYYAPPWEADFHNDENIQMNYWAALPGNLAETTLPYFDYYNRSMDDYAMNARGYVCRGILSPISQSTHGRMHYGPWLNWTAGAGWLSQLYYDYYAFTGDQAFLREQAVPFLKQVALFYEDFLIEDDNGTLMVIPSLSPENKPDIPGGALATINATMDIAIIREVLTNLIDACQLLDMEAEGVARWQAMLRKLPAYEVNEDGAIKEWIHPALKDNYHHRHQSHIYALFPGLEITEETDPELFKACRVAVEKRLVVGLTSQTGWSFAHMANIYARLGQGDRALECLALLTRACTGPNLFTYHNDWRGQGLTLGHGPGTAPLFQIDANFGFVAAVLEMCCFSMPGWLKLLPALPSDWCSGTIRGLRARGGITVSIEWDLDQNRVRATLQADRDQEITLKFPAPVSALETNLPANAVQPSEHGPAYRRISLPATTSVTLNATLVLGRL